MKKTYEEAVDEFERAVALAGEMRKALQETNRGEEGGGWIHALTVPFGDFRIGLSLGVDDDEGVTLALFPKDLGENEWPEWEVALAYFPFPKMDEDEMKDALERIAELKKTYPEVEEDEPEPEGERNWAKEPDSWAYE